MGSSFDALMPGLFDPCSLCSLAAAGATTDAGLTSKLRRLCSQKPKSTTESQAEAEEARCRDTPWLSSVLLQLHVLLLTFGDVPSWFQGTSNKF